MGIPKISYPVPCMGGCGTKAVNHINGSEVAKRCRKGSPGRSPSLKVKNLLRNQDIKTRSRINDGIGFHNTMVQWTEKILNVMLKQSHIHKVKIRGYDKQTEEFLEGNSDPMFNDARTDLDTALREYTDNPTPELKEELDNALQNLREKAELRYLRLVEDRRIKEGFNWQRSIDIYCAKAMATQKYKNMSDAERKEAVAKAEEDAKNAPPADPAPSGEDELHFDIDDETTQLGLSLIQQELQDELDRNGGGKSQPTLILPEDNSKKPKPKLILPDDPDQWSRI